MLRTEKKESIVLLKILYTFIILLVYLIGKGLPLYMIDVSAYIHKTVDASELLMQSISGDIYKCSLFALGISPYMIASMLVQIINAFRKSEIRKKISPKKNNKMVLTIMVIIAFVQAVLQVQELIFRASGAALVFAKTVAVLQMVTGALIILWLASRNKTYGIGGQSALIFANIIDGIMATLKGHDLSELFVPVIVSIFVMIVVVIMENTELRIPVQRISIHNIYADKNYLAIKLNPIGVMPAMFSTAFFMLPQMLITVLLWIVPDNMTFIWLHENVTLTKPAGILVYVILLYVLSIGFSRVFVNPKELTEQYLKSGDSLLDIHAGKDTRKYLSNMINVISIFSATVMGVCLVVPMVLQLTGSIHSTLVTLPSSVLMLTGIWCNLYREVSAIMKLEAYKPFI